MKGNLTRKDFLAYLAMGGSVNFDKVIYLNKQQLKKLTNDQRQGRSPVYIDGKEGFVGGDGSWTPKKVK